MSGKVQRWQFLWQSTPSLAGFPNKSPNSWNRFAAAHAAPRAPRFPEGTAGAAGPRPAVLRHTAAGGDADAQSKVNLPPSCIASQKKLNLSRNLPGITYSPHYSLRRGRLRVEFPHTQQFRPPAPLYTLLLGPDWEH